MKLRYYLRGLGIGILVTAFIMSIARGPESRMSDAEIRARAAELGMVDANSQVLSNLSQGNPEDGGETTPETEGTEPSQGANPVGAGLGNATDDSQAGPEQTPEDGQGQDSEAGLGDLDAQGDESDAEPFSGTQGNLEGRLGEMGESSQEPVEPSVETVRFTIRGGMGSESISSELAAAGLVESATEYDSFLCDNGYSQRLRSGTFEIPVGASYEEIARMITGG